MYRRFVGWNAPLPMGPAGATDDAPDHGTAPRRLPSGRDRGKSVPGSVILAHHPRANDGKVSVARTRIDGMTDHAVLRATHTLMVRNDEVIRQTIHFLRHGHFVRAPGYSAPRDALASAFGVCPPVERFPGRWWHKDNNNTDFGD